MLHWRDNWNYEQLGNTTIRMLTFQSNDVAIAVQQADHYAISSMSRERHDYSADIAQLDGYVPIWCISPAPIKTAVSNRFSVEDLLDAEIFQHARCEMSLREAEGLEEFTCIEFEIPADKVKFGLTHSAHRLVAVVPYISTESLVAMYKLEYDRNLEYGWYYPTVIPIKVFKYDACFTETTRCVHPRQQERKSV